MGKIGRLNKIIRVLAKYGFGEVAGKIKVFSLIPFFAFGKKYQDKSTGVRIRLVLEELGPTFIKLGQVASTRADVFPSDWIEELKKLQDNVPPITFSEVKLSIERSLKKPIGEIFETFDETPTASASIAQVHFATIKVDRKIKNVAVKVKRPNIEETIEADLSVMLLVAELLEKHVRQARRYRAIDIVGEFARVIHREQDLSVEGGNLHRFRRIFKDEERLYIPDVYWDYTTPDVLTMERISGVPIDEVDAIAAKGLDIKKIATDGIEIFFIQVFEYGIFHGDLHPGNIFVRDDGVIIYLDFGIVGRLDKELRTYLASMLFHLMKQDYHKMALVHRDMGLIGREVDIYEFEEALRDISEPIFGRNLEDIRISMLLMDLIETAKRFDMVLQPNLLLLQKSMVIIEGVGRQLYPDVNLWEVAKPLVYKWMAKEKLSPTKIFEKGSEIPKEILGTMVELPSQINRLVKTTLDDELRVNFVHNGIEPVITELKNIGKNIGTGLIIAALILGSAIIYVFAAPDVPRYMGLPYLTITGIMAASVMAIRLWWIALKDKN